MVLRRATLSIALILAAVAPVAAQAPARPAPVTPEQRQERQQELKRTEEELQRSQAENARLAAEIAQIRGDRQKLNADLIATSQRVQEAETKVQAAERRIAALAETEAALKTSLGARRGTIVEVLASLQRAGRKPPPAVLVRPEDMVQAIRTSMLLGAALPELRREAEALVEDLTALVRARDAMATEGAALTAEAERQRGERQRLAALIAARQGQLESNEQRLAEERRRIQVLGLEAQSLKELITRMESEIASASRAAQAAKAAPPPSQNPVQAAALAPGALRDAARLQPKMAFQDTKGTLSWPASGQMLRSFGASDGAGGRETGVAIETAKAALVTTPVDGWISYAGPYRSYGHVLIINAGGGYHIVMTGLDRVSVDTGQFVLAGEPVASMGGSPAGALAAETGSGLPVIYIEFRKDGAPIDPGPWWAKSDGEKVRG
jgi:murein hydrolase activator